jgi:hypothetical protein
VGKHEYCSWKGKAFPWGRASLLASSLLLARRAISTHTPSQGGRAAPSASCHAATSRMACDRIPLSIVPIAPQASPGGGDKQPLCFRRGIQRPASPCSDHTVTGKWQNGHLPALPSPVAEIINRSNRLAVFMNSLCRKAAYLSGFVARGRQCVLLRKTHHCGPLLEGVRLRFPLPATHASAGHSGSGRLRPGGTAPRFPHHIPLCLSLLFAEAPPRDVF